MVDIIINEISKTINLYVEVINTTLVQKLLCTLLHPVCAKGYSNSAEGYHTPVPTAELFDIPNAGRSFWQ